MLLILFAFLAGLVTIVSPCILPILPAVLSAGASGGKRRPIGIVIGLVASFTFFTVAVRFLVQHIGLNPNALREAAIVILLAFGLVLFIPKLAERLETWVSARVARSQQSGERRDFWGGILLGISLGIVWTPCVGPIVAAVIALAATSSVTLTSVLIMAAYAAGAAVPLFFVMQGGKRIMARFNQHTPVIQRVFGLIMVLTAVAMLTGLDQTVEASLLARLPAGISTGLTQQLEESGLVQGQIKQLTGNAGTPGAAQVVAGTSSGLPVLGTAPDFTGISHWLNSSPLTMAQLKGKVVLVDFWTYSCINCLRTLPHVIDWYNTYKDQGFVVVGVHSPEFAFEKDTSNVSQALTRLGVTYPVAQDNDLATWSAYQNEYWPAEYLIDAQGRIRATSFGEGDYDESEANIRSLLQEAKQSALPSPAPSVPDLTPTERLSPETYLGTDRQSDYLPSANPSALAADQWTLSGSWQVGSQYITSGAAGDALSYDFIGKNVYLVINPPQAGATVQVLLDGKPIGSQGGADVHDSLLTLDTDRLYHLAQVGSPGTPHLLTLIFQTSGTKAFSFTFG